MTIELINLCVMQMNQFHLKSCLLKEIEPIGDCYTNTSGTQLWAINNVRINETMDEERKKLMDQMTGMKTH